MELLTPSTEKAIYSVSALNRETKDLLASHFSFIQVEGEISNLSRPSSGHIYFSLKDATAQVRCAMFRSQLQRLNFKPENGKKVILTAQVSLYEARGDYQLIANKMQPAGAGDLQLAFEKLKNKLQQEGLFDSSIKKPIPSLPGQIAIISSPSGAAVHDILSVLKRRFPIIPLIIYPTSVQGENAKNEIVKAIESANKNQENEVIILARGGGSLEDLWAFNEECVARAIANSQLPIISGIGHEVDFSIADFVADLRAPTPSAAAETAVPNQLNWLATYRNYEIQLGRLVQTQLSQHKQSIHWLKQRLQQQHPSQQFHRHAQTLDHLQARLQKAIEHKIAKQQHQLGVQQQAIKQHSPSNRVLRYQQQLQYLKQQLHNSINHKLENLRRKQAALASTLNAVSPLATLDRGYSITSLDKTSKVLTSSQQLAVKQRIKTRLAHGHIISQIEEVHHE